MKTRVKGNRIQRKCIEHFKELGCEVAKVEVGGKFVKEKDMFGLFDIICIHATGFVSFVQITSNRPHTHKKYIEFSKKYKRLKIIFSQFVWIDRKGFKVFYYSNGNKKVEKLY